tara:strand:- start:1881 stop:2069 length:189 start_codon:yes stop_codon:yes gene_type:complete
MEVGSLVQEITTGEIGLVVDDPELMTTFQQVIAGDLHKYWLVVLWTDGKTRLIRRQKVKELT